MIRLKIHGIMKARGISAYALSKGTDLSYPGVASRVGWCVRASARRYPQFALRLLRPPAGLAAPVGAVARQQQVRWPAFDCRDGHPSDCKKLQSKWRVTAGRNG
jgi:hypothetical protein